MSKKKTHDVLSTPKSAPIHAFAPGFFLSLMNRYAPRGYRFVIVGDERRIALRCPEFMGNQTPSGPFVSEFSFDMLDDVYGGLMTKSAMVLNPAQTPEFYMRDYELARLDKHPITISQATANDRLHDIYLNVIQRKRAVLFALPPLFFRKNAILIQGLMDSCMCVPKYLNNRIARYVSDCTWCAITRAMSCMSISRMRAFQDDYKEKSQELGFTSGKKSRLTKIENAIRAKNYENTDIYISWLRYDVLPMLDSASRSVLENHIMDLTKIRDSYGIIPMDKPACDMMPNFFFAPQQTTVRAIVPNQITAPQLQEPIDLDIDDELSEILPSGSLSLFADDVVPIEWSQQYQAQQTLEKIIPSRPNNIPAPADKCADKAPVYDTRPRCDRHLETKSVPYQFLRMATLKVARQKKK